MPEFEILALGPFRAETLHIYYDPTSGCMPVDDFFSAQANAAWQEHSSRRAALGLNHSNDELVRLARFTLKQNDTLLELSLGRTDFREFVATRSREALRHRNWSRLANPLAVASVVVTNDDKILVGRRPNIAHIHAGKYFVFGGFVDRADLTELDGVFHSIKREIHEELGVDFRAFSDICCTGLNYDLTCPHPELSFSVRIAESFATIATYTPTDKEVTALESIDNTPQAISSFLDALHPDGIVGTAEACLLLHGRLNFGDDWFHRTLTGIHEAGDYIQAAGA